MAVRLLAQAQELPQQQDHIDDVLQVAPWVVALVRVQGAQGEESTCLIQPF